ncbi:hypothetical protein E8E12_001665 [Didymella heteroderae]|uniref:F-box domain-containing protein n=1 Tax=Didymella heteroderae TaxID=1769908 RepID=A0A9P5BYA7_9PLEO|nr:hypothetical protein E8E12_001665 [Didymella heteroderae]
MINSENSMSSSSGTTTNTCFVTDLSTELIYYIIDFIPYEFQFNFALTCKRLADCSRKILKRHQEAFKKYRVASDILPTTVPTLLRSIFGRADPILAWHVRSLEVWYDRESWLDWKPLSFDRPMHEDDMDIDSTPWEWQDDELEEYLEDIEDQLVALLNGGDEEVFVEARQQFEDGRDGILKALLITYCPRLQDIKFVTYEHREKSTLGWLKRIVQGSIQYGSHWPPGLCSVNNVAVGVESDSWMTGRHTQHNDPPLDGTDRSMEVFSVLLRLPFLQSIYYNDLRRPGWGDQTDYGSHALIPKCSSNVKNIFLDDCGDMPYPFRFALPRASRALETFTLRVGHSGDRLDDVDELVSGLSREQQNSLHTLMFYGPNISEEMHGYRCNVYRNEELKEAHSLKTVAIDISDVELDAFYSTSSFANQDVGKDWAPDQWRTYFIKWFCEHAFPHAVERIVLWGLPSEHFLAKCEGVFLDWLEDALIFCIESWASKSEAASDGQLNTGQESFYTNLKAIYLEDIERQYITYPYNANKKPKTKKVYFRRLVQVAKKASVDVYTLTNRAPAKHSHNFPVAPDKYDLKSGPWWEHRHERREWVFDVHAGRFVAPGCGKCGACETCSSVYTKDLWEALDDREAS